MWIIRVKRGAHYFDWETREQTPWRWPRLQAGRSCSLFHSPLLTLISVSCWKNIRYLLWFSSSNVPGSQAQLVGDTASLAPASITGLLPHGVKKKKKKEKPQEYQVKSKWLCWTHLNFLRDSRLVSFIWLSVAIKFLLQWWCQGFLVCFLVSKQ